MLSRRRGVKVPGRNGLAPFDFPGGWPG